MSRALAGNLSSGLGRVRLGLIHRLGYMVALCLAAGVASLGAPAPASAEGCANVAFRTGPSAHLPDCRAYEMVSPPFKNGGYVQTLAQSPDGSSVLLHASSAFAGIEGFSDFLPSGAAAFYATQRTASGWVAVATEPPASEYQAYQQDGFSSFFGVAGDARTTFWLDRGPGRPGNSIDIYRREANGPLVDVGPALPPTAPSSLETNLLGKEAALLGVAVSPDGSHVFFTLGGNEPNLGRFSGGFYWPFDQSQERFASLYEYAGVGNTTPMLVGVDNEGHQISQCGTALGQGGESPFAGFGGAPASSDNAISHDGEVVFFTAYPPNHGCSESPLPITELFARIGNGTPGAHTVAISEPSVEDCSECDTEAGVLARPTFLGASEDGSKVFFLTNQPLLGGDASRNIYEYDLDAPVGQRVVRVSGGDGTVSDPVAEVVGTPQVSEDGSHVYFIARGVLTKKTNVFGQSAQAGANNLYVFERDAAAPAGRTAFIATLSADSPESLWTAGGSGASTGANLTPDGRFLLFTSRTDLTPDDTSAEQQLFEYDSLTGALVRVSVGQDGFNDDGNATVGDGKAEIVSPHYEGEDIYDEYASLRSMSANGSYVFFQSPVGLTPEAFNDKIVSAEGEQTYVMNVYEDHDGVVSLISDGRDITTLRDEGTKSNVKLLGTDESGEDVFFETADQLVAQDTDDNNDVYDARVDGGFPAPPQPAGCLGEACQGQLSGAPTLLSPGSEFQAGGNPPLATQATAAKPKAKAKKGAKKKGKKKRKGPRAKRRGRKANTTRRGGR